MLLSLAQPDTPEKSEIGSAAVSLQDARLK
jgi:hypothetical protein